MRENPRMSMILNLSHPVSNRYCLDLEETTSPQNRFSSLIHVIYEIVCHLTTSEILIPTTNLIKCSIKILTSTQTSLTLRLLNYLDKHYSENRIIDLFRRLESTLRPEMRAYIRESIKDHICYGALTLEFKMRLLNMIVREFHEAEFALLIDSFKPLEPALKNYIIEQVSGQDASHTICQWVKQHMTLSIQELTIMIDNISSFHGHWDIKEFLPRELPTNVTFISTSFINYCSQFLALNNAKFLYNHFFSLIDKESLKKGVIELLKCPSSLQHDFALLIINDANISFQAEELLLLLNYFKNSSHVISQDDIQIISHIIKISIIHENRAADIQDHLIAIFQKVHSFAEKIYIDFIIKFSQDFNLLEGLILAAYKTKNYFLFKKCINKITHSTRVLLLEKIIEDIKNKFYYSSFYLYSVIDNFEIDHEVIQEAIHHLLTYLEPNVNYEQFVSAIGILLNKITNPKLKFDILIQFVIQYKSIPPGLFEKLLKDKKIICNSNIFEEMQELIKWMKEDISQDTLNKNIDYLKLIKELQKNLILDPYQLDNLNKALSKLE